MNWKITAIVFIALFCFETLYICYGFYLYYDELNKMNTCYYEICSGYPDVYYKAGICSCFDYDIIGNLEIVKTKWLK